MRASLVVVAALAVGNANGDDASPATGPHPHAARQFNLAVSALRANYEKLGPFSATVRLESTIRVTPQLQEIVGLDALAPSVREMSYRFVADPDRFRCLYYEDSEYEPGKTPLRVLTNDHGQWSEFDLEKGILVRRPANRLGVTSVVDVRMAFLLQRGYAAFADFPSRYEVLDSGRSQSNPDRYWVEILSPAKMLKGRLRLECDANLGGMPIGSRHYRTNGALLVVCEMDYERVPERDVVMVTGAQIHYYSSNKEPQPNPAAWTEEFLYTVSDFKLLGPEETAAAFAPEESLGAVVQTVDKTVSREPPRRGAPLSPSPGARSWTTWLIVANCALAGIIVALVTLRRHK